MAASEVSSAENLLSRLEAAVIDGRARNIRYRQNQLHLLHCFLRENADAICTAIRRDEESTPEEAELEYYLAMKAVEQIYEQLNFEQSLEEEYAVTKHKNNVHRRVPFGIVLIRPGTYTRLFSTVAPLAAALGAGSAVLFEIPSTLRHLDTLLRQALKALDHDLCGISTQTVTDEAFLSRCIIVDQTKTTKQPPANLLESNSQSLAIAIVDRTANIDEAAAFVTTARCAFNGRSPHAPDIVLVNEFVKQDFNKACLQHLTTVTAALASKPVTRSSQDTLDSAYPADSYETIFASNKTKLLDLHKGQKIASTKITSPSLMLTVVTGLVDSLTLASSAGPLEACYCFGDLKGAKFLSQHIDSRAVFVNHIPADWLVGPSVPTSVANVNPSLRYDMNMFSVSRPEQVTLVDQSSDVASKYLYGPSKDMQSLRQKAATPLKPTGQPSGSSMGFFDQGIITGLVAFVLPSLGLLGFSVYQASRYGIRYFSS